MGLYKVLVVPDYHAPFHDKKAFGIMLKVAKDLRPNEVILLGDAMDCYSVSAYDKEPQKNFKLLEDELKQARPTLFEIEKACKGAKFTYLAGNHEARISKYINVYGSMLSGIMSEREIIQVPKKWKYLQYGQEGHYKIGNWVFTHGTVAGRTPAVAMINKYGTNVCFGHVHKLQKFVTSNFHGELIQAVTPGWLGDLRRAAEYIKDVAGWAHGFAVAYFSSNGAGHLETIVIEKHRAVFNGKLY